MGKEEGKKPEQEKVKNPIGRPMKWTLKKSIEEAEWMLSYLKSQDKNAQAVFTLSYLCEFRGYSVDHFDHIIARHTKPKDGHKISCQAEYFSQLIKRIRSILETRIVTYSLANKLNVKMAIFVLKNHYGYKEKIEHSGNVPMQFNVINDSIPRPKNNKNNEEIEESDD